MSTSPSPSATSGVVEDEDDKVARRRKYHETQMTAGCGYGKYKKRLLEMFWDTLWPNLVKAGWRRQTTTGQRQGIISAFCPPGCDNIDNQKYIKGEHYFIKIKEVIDRVCGEEALGSKEETAASQSFRQVFESGPDGTALQIGPNETLDVPVPRSRRRQVNSTKAAAAAAATKVKLDLSWKYDGVAFPKASSKVGAKYQAPAIPDAGTFDAAKAHEDPDLQVDQVWDNKRAQGTLQFLLGLPPNQKEAALAILHSANYSIVNIGDVLQKVDYKDGSNWTQQQREHFHDEMFRLRKNIVAVAKSTGYGVNACYAYYLAKFKKSNDYRLLKTICEEERAEKMATSDQLDACGICGDGGSLLICDGCEGEYHMTCLRPPLVAVPEGVWHCDSCVDIKFLDIRDKLVQKLYVEVGSSLKRKADEMEGDDEAESPTRKAARNKIDDSGELILQPSEAVLAAVKDLAKAIAQALTPAAKAAAATEEDEKIAGEKTSDDKTTEEEPATTIPEAHAMEVDDATDEAETNVKEEAETPAEEEAASTAERDTAADAGAAAADTTKADAEEADTTTKTDANAAEAVKVKGDSSGEPEAMEE